MGWQQFNWKKGIGLGFISGVLWSWIALVVNGITAAFPYEFSWLYNLVIFSIGGAIFGIVIGGMMVVMENRLPFKRSLLNLAFLSTSLWLVLSMTGILLSLINPARYHPVLSQTLQGFVLSILLGCILGFLWEKTQSQDHHAGRYDGAHD